MGVAPVPLTKGSIMADLPTERLYIENVDVALATILAFAAKLESEGKRPWFEVWYPLTTSADFDAVEVFDHVRIETLPPYHELVTT